MSDEFVPSIFDIGRWKIDPTKLEAVSAVITIRSGELISDMRGESKAADDCYYFIVIVNRVKYCSDFYSSNEEATEVRNNLEKMQEETAGMET